MKSYLAKITPLCALAGLILAACDMVQVYQGQIEKATRAIEAATTDAARAAAHADRGRGYSDKARLSLVRSQIDHAEFVRLFDLAIRDHDQAIALAPDDGEMYYARGRSNYDRAALANEPVADHTPWFDAARSDFSAAVEKDPKHRAAYDFLGIVEEQTGRFDEAVAAYTHEMALDPRSGRMRLSDLYCNRGQAYLKDKNFELAAVDLEKSVEFSAKSDGCSCEPYNPLAYIYIDAVPQYEKGWDLVRRAHSSGNPIAAEYVERLKKQSGRSG